jgi:hypothetical protein
MEFLGNGDDKTEKGNRFGFLFLFYRPDKLMVTLFNTLGCFW